jgi:hypothetical protein
MTLKTFFELITNNEFRQTLLMITCQKGHVKIVNDLLSTCGSKFINGIVYL